MRLLPSLVCCLIIAGLAGCASRDGNRWNGHKKPGTFAVVVAPVDSTPIDTVWEGASATFAFDLANRIDILGKDADGWSNETLPRSSTDAWTALAQAAPEADWTVVTILESVTLDAAPFGKQWTARVTMIAHDAAGREVFRRTAHGTAEPNQSPKMLSPAAKPECVAAWEACANASSALIEALRTRQDHPAIASEVTAAPAPATVVLTLGSVPDHADVLLDGKFAGTTPVALTLRTKPVTVRIERQGYQPWERVITPAEGMQLAPALEPQH